MTIEGSLDVVTVPELLQFIALSNSTGTLSIRRGDSRVELGFHEGSIINGWANRSKRLGEALVSAKVVSQSIVDKAVELQNMTRPRRPLGDILFAAGAVTAQDLQDAVVAQVEDAIDEVLDWSNGSFEFVRESPRQFDPEKADTGFLVERIKVDVQEMLLRLTRRLEVEQQASEHAVPVASPDTAGQTGPAAPKTGRGDAPPAADVQQSAVAPAPTSVPPRDGLHVIGWDDDLYERVRVSLGPGHGTWYLVEPDEDRPTPSEADHARVVLLDLRHDSDPARIVDLRHRYTHAQMIAVIDGALEASMAYSCGVDSAVPADPDIIASCLRSLDAVREESGSGPPVPRSVAPLAKLRQVTAEIRSGAQSSNIVLALLHVVSESAERAIVFLIRNHDLLSIGAFGTGRDDRPLAILCQGNPTLDSLGETFTEVLEGGRASRFRFDETTVPKALAAILGPPPASRDAVLLPIIGSSRPLALIYCDNGPKPTPISDLALLEIAGNQAGMSLENVLLRRRLGRGSAPRMPAMASSTR